MGQEFQTTFPAAKNFSLGGGGGRGIPFYGATLASPTHPPLSAVAPLHPLVEKQMTVSLFLLFKSLVLSGWGLPLTSLSLSLSLSLSVPSAKVNCLLLAPDSLSPHYIEKISHLLFLSPILAAKFWKLTKFDFLEVYGDQRHYLAKKLGSLIELS